jgi:Flp pilus assembly protein TadG
MRSVFLYTFSRLALFAATVGVLYVTGIAHGFLLLALAVLISGIVSYVLLSGQRDKVSAALTSRADRLRRGLAEGAAREDDDAERGPTRGEG